MTPTPTPTTPAALPAAASDPARKPAPRNAAFIGFLVAVSCAFGLILWPYFGAVLWALIITLVFAPLDRWLCRRLGNRPTWSALATVAIVSVIVILPLVLMGASLVGEAATLYTKMRSGEIDVGRYFQRIFGALPGWVVSLLERFGLGDLAAMQQRLAAALSQGSQTIAARVFSIGQNTLDLVVNLCITIYLAFFFLRDRSALAQEIRTAVPLNPGDKGTLIGQFATVIRATVKGNIVVAVTQGALGGIAFWFLGIGGALVWSVVMAVVSLLPAVGAALVWLPVALYLLAIGAVAKGIGLIVWGVVVIGLVDNVLRPVLVGKDTKLPDYVVLMSTLGGIVVFGINGFVVGPVIAAMFIAAWKIYGDRRAELARMSAPD